jgi:type VI protein secretion system component VasK
MIVLSLILVVIAVAAALILAMQNGQHIQLHVLGAHFSISAYWLAIAGLVIMAIFVVGVATWRAGARHATRRRRERRELTRENRRLTERNETLQFDHVNQPRTEG